MLAERVLYLSSMASLRSPSSYPQVEVYALMADGPVLKTDAGIRRHLGDLHRQRVLEVGLGVKDRSPGRQCLHDCVQIDQPDTPCGPLYVRGMTDLVGTRNAPVMQEAPECVGGSEGTRPLGLRWLRLLALLQGEHAGRAIDADLDRLPEFALVIVVHAVQVYAQPLSDGRHGKIGLAHGCPQLVEVHLELLGGARLPLLHVCVDEAPVVGPGSRPFRFAFSASATGSSISL